MESVFQRFPFGIKIMLQWLEAARLLHRMAVQVRTDEETRQRTLKELSCIAMQSGARGRQARTAFMELLRKARVNIDERRASEAAAAGAKPARRMGQDVYD